MLSLDLYLQGRVDGHGLHDGGQPGASAVAERVVQPRGPLCNLLDRAFGGGVDDDVDRQATRDRQNTTLRRTRGWLLIKRCRVLPRRSGEQQRGQQRGQQRAEQRELHDTKHSRRQRKDTGPEGERHGSGGGGTCLTERVLQSRDQA